jgi:hypothetical protein
VFSLDVGAESSFEPDWETGRWLWFSSGASCLCVAVSCLTLEPQFPPCEVGIKYPMDRMPGAVLKIAGI